MSSHSWDEESTMMKRVKAIKTAAHPAEVPVLRWLAALAFALALVAIPHLAHAQGVVRGAQEGAYEGNRVAGPIGGAVGGAVGAGVGGAVGAVDGILGIPYHGRYHCRGYYNRYGHFHCYR
jgi:hypothetical protein